MSKSLCSLLRETGKIKSSVILGTGHIKFVEKTRQLYSFWTLGNDIMKLDNIL
jgi:hypothetical protein